jgi:hypothetical protein
VKRGGKKKDESSELFENPEISFKIEGYGDLFSDFDPREYHQRALSVDFLDELRRASVDKKAKDRIVLDLFLHNSKRDKEEERVIVKRLKNHFLKHYVIMKNEKREIRKDGWAYVFSGLVVMFLASLMMFFNPARTLFMNFLVIVLEPAGWFLFWEGLGLVVFKAKETEPEFMFNKKMKDCTIRFLS